MESRDLRLESLGHFYCKAIQSYSCGAAYWQQTLQTCSRSTRSGKILSLSISYGCTQPYPFIFLGFLLLARSYRPSYCQKFLGIGRILDEITCSKVIRAVICSLWYKLKGHMGRKY